MFRDQIQDRISRRRWAAQLVAIAALGFVVAPMVAGTQAHAQMTGEPKLLLLPIVVHSAEAPEYVRGGLADMLRARFARIGGVELLAEEDVDKGTSNLQEALKIARAVGADYVLFGSFTRFGKGASLDVQCAPAAGGPNQEPLREIFVHSGSIGEIIPDLDELAGKVTRFARGEIVAGPSSVGSSPSVPARELKELAGRVSALEEAIAQLLEEESVEEP
jgi:TolB-like protein